MNRLFHRVRLCAAFCAALFFSLTAVAQIGGPILGGGNTKVGGPFPGAAVNAIPFANPANIWATDPSNFTYTIGTGTLTVANVQGASGTLNITPAGGQNVQIGSGGASLALRIPTVFTDNGRTLCWRNGAACFADEGVDNAIAQRNGTNAQTFRVYNTFTDASNYERLSSFWSGNVAFFKMENAGSGTPRVLQLQGGGIGGLAIGGAGSASNWNFSTNGHLLATTDNSFDIGATAATRPRDLFLGRQLALQGATNDTTLLSMSGASVTGSGTTSHAALAGTWNTSGVVPGFLNVNVTNTASGAGSRLLELQRGGVLQFGVTSGAASTGTQIRTAQATAPTCTTNCGTPGNVCVGSDSSMICTMGTTPASGFVITFNGTWAAAPSCIAQAALAGMATGKKPLTVVTAATTITVVTDGTAPVAGDKYAILCMGVQ